MVLYKDGPKCAPLWEIVLIIRITRGQKPRNEVQDMPMQTNTHLSKSPASPPGTHQSITPTPQSQPPLPLAPVNSLDILIAPNSRPDQIQLLLSHQPRKRRTLRQQRNRHAILGQRRSPLVEKHRVLRTPICRVLLLAYDKRIGVELGRRKQTGVRIAQADADARARVAVAVADAHRAEARAGGRPELHA